jgi:hypothetical protein
LCLVALGFIQEAELAGRFHAFGRDPHVQAVRHRDHGARDRGVVSVLRQAVDERAIELERLRGKPLQVGPRRMAGAEVVEGDAHARRVQPLQRAPSALGVGHQRAFGDFDLQPAGIQPRGFRGG